MIVRGAMERKLTEALKPARLRIVDESHRHAGHVGANPQGESHFSVEVVSSAFDGMGRVARQRLVYQVLAEELSGRVHALSVAALTPEEAGL